MGGVGDGPDHEGAGGVGFVGWGGVGEDVAAGGRGNVSGGIVLCGAVGKEERGGERRGKGREGKERLGRVDEPVADSDGAGGREEPENLFEDGGSVGEVVEQVAGGFEAGDRGGEVRAEDRVKFGG